MRRAGQLLALVVLMAALLSVACRRRQGAGDGRRVIFGKIEIQDRTPAGERIIGVDGESLRGWVVQRFRSAPEVALAEGQPRPGAYRLVVEIGVGEGDEGRLLLGSARASVPGASDGVDLQASAVRPLPRGDAAGEVPRVRRAVEGLADDIVFQAGLAVGPTQRVVQALSSRKDVARLSATIEIAGVRKVREAVPALIELLRHKEETVSDRAIGALVAIGDRRAVKPLTNVARFQDTARMAKVLDAIGALGGQEAHDYLEFVSTGHEDPDIRNLASEALERMNRERKEPGRKQP